MSIKARELLTTIKQLRKLSKTKNYQYFIESDPWADFSTSNIYVVTPNFAAQEAPWVTMRLMGYFGTI